VGFPRGVLFSGNDHDDEAMKSENSKHLWSKVPATRFEETALREVLHRYRLRPDGEVWRWITSFDRLITRDEQQWFLSHRDFTDRPPSGEFRWNEYELMSLDAAGDDDEWKARIDGFWTQHLPLYLDVGDCYRALVARISQGSCVGIFESIEPEFEEVTPFAASIDEMLLLILGQEKDQLQL
jgi:hypothetical protein